MTSDFWLGVAGLFLTVLGVTWRLSAMLKGTDGKIETLTEKIEPLTKLPEKIARGEERHRALVDRVEKLEDHEEAAIGFKH